MTWRRLSWSWLRRRLAWRLCLLFVVGALLPVALSDWLVISVMDGLAQQMDTDRRVAAVRATSRQVLDRVKVAEVFLQSIADSGRDAQVSAAPAFDGLWCPQPGQGPSPGNRSDAALHAAWLRAMPDSRVQGPELALSPGDPVRVLMATAAGDGRPCIGRLASDFLWEPLRNAAEDGAWTVRDSSGPAAGHRPGRGRRRPARRRGGPAVHSARLFLDRKARPRNGRSPSGRRARASTGTTSPCWHGCWPWPPAPCCPSRWSARAASGARWHRSTLDGGHAASRPGRGGRAGRHP